MSNISDQPNKGRPITTRDKYPCKDCEERSFRCHDVCLKYFSAKLAAETRKKVEQNNRRSESECNARELSRNGRKPRQI